jgi:hypothetical protein
MHFAIIAYVICTRLFLNVVLTSIHMQLQVQLAVSSACVKAKGDHIVKREYALLREVHIGITRTTFLPVCQQLQERQLWSSCSIYSRKKRNKVLQLRQHSSSLQGWLQRFQL